MSSFVSGNPSWPFERTVSVSRRPLRSYFTVSRLSHGSTSSTSAARTNQPSSPTFSLRLSARTLTCDVARLRFDSSDSPHPQSRAVNRKADAVVVVFLIFAPSGKNFAISFFSRETPLIPCHESSTLSTRVHRKRFHAPRCLEPHSRRRARYAPL